MKTEKVMEVLRQVEWAGAVPHRKLAVAVYPPGGPGQCPWCGGWESEGHYDDCKLAALLDEAEGLDREGCWRDGKRVGQEEKQDELAYPIMICSVCKKLDSLCECEGEPIRWRIFDTVGLLDEGEEEKADEEPGYPNILAELGAGLVMTEGEKAVTVGERLDALEETTRMLKRWAAWPRGQGRGDKT